MAMRLLTAAAAAVLWAVPAAASPLSGDIGLVSDYRYRGLSLSDGNPALQGSLTLEHGGFYGTVWGSTLRRIGDPSDSEIDLTAGYERELAEWISLDVSATRYFYPSSGGDDYSEASAAVTLSRGSAEATAGLSYAPRQRALRDDSGRRRDDLYAFAGARYAVPRTPVTLAAGAGYERGAFDEVRRGGKWDWTVGAEIERGRAKVGLSCVGSNADGESGHALVGAIALSW
jgi:uncharacterized protein (TIGR02001 family)